MHFPVSISDVPGHVLIAVPLIILVAYTIFGATGFGSSIMCVPALAHFFPLTFAVPLVTTMDSFGATATAIRLRRLTAWAELRRLLPGLFIGMTFGATLLVSL